MKLKFYIDFLVHFNFFHFVTKYFIVTLFEGTLTCCQALQKIKVFSELFSMVFDRSNNIAMARGRHILYG